MNSLNEMDGPRSGEAAQNLNPSKDNVNFARELIEHVESLAGTAIPHEEILDSLLEKIKPVDFRQLAELEESEKLTEAHYLVISVEEVIRIARAHSWGMAKEAVFTYLYNGNFWEPVSDNNLRAFLGEAAERMGVEKHKRARHFMFREKLLKQFAALTNLTKPQEQKGSVLINLKNGTFEINGKGHRLREFRPSDFIKYQLPFQYNPQAVAPIFREYLNRVLPDVERQRVLSEFLGYVFTTGLKLEKALMLYGPGANGKSVFYDIVNALLGPKNVCSYSLSSLTDVSGYYRAKLQNSLVNYASEINGNLETSYFKALVSGEPVEARLPYGEPFILSNYAKLVFNCNELPREVEHTPAYFRRFLIIGFEVEIPELEQDKELSKRIISSELPGVFNWVLEGLDRLLVQRRFSRCEAAERQLEEYRRTSDNVRMFVEECNYQPSENPAEYLLLGDVYSKYRAFCTEDGTKALGKQRFNKRLAQLGFISEKRNKGMAILLKRTSETPF